MRSYDVHVFAQVRIKIQDVKAEGPRAAIDAITEDETLLDEIHRLVDVDGAGGRIAAIEFQGEAIPEGWLVDPKDENEAGHGDGITFDADKDGRPVLMFDPSNMPNVFQTLWAATSGVALPAHVDRRQAMERLSGIDEFAAGLFSALGSASSHADADALLASKIEVLEGLRAEISKTDDRADPSIPVGVAEALSPHGLKAVFVASEDGSVDDSIEIRREADDAEMADIQICQDDTYGVNIWSDDMQVATIFGGFYPTAALAAAGAVDLLKKRKRL